MFNAYCSLTFCWILNCSATSLQLRCDLVKQTVESHNLGRIYQLEWRYESISSSNCSSSAPQTYHLENVTLPRNSKFWLWHNLYVWKLVPRCRKYAYKCVKCKGYNYFVFHGDGVAMSIEARSTFKYFSSSSSISSTRSTSTSRS